MNKDKSRIIFIAAGLLDLVSFWRTYRIAWNDIVHFRLAIVPLLELLLIVSLVFSGLLLLLDKKSGFYLYLFQFPLKLAFMILTFGFLLQLIPYGGPLVYKIELGIVIGLEMLRLYFSVNMIRR